MIYKHRELASGRWFKLSFFDQMANIGSEVSRAILWREKKREYSLLAIERALELLDLTALDVKNRRAPKLRELLRARELLVDYFYFDNQYSSSDKLWQDYFYPFNYASRMNK